VQAWVRHDTTDRPIRLPLRRIAPELVRQELSNWPTGGVRDSAPKSTFLEGYAYERDDRVWRWTAFGAGLATLFGIAPVGLLQ